MQPGRPIAKNIPLAFDCLPSDRAAPFDPRESRGRAKKRAKGIFYFKQKFGLSDPFVMKAQHADAFGPFFGRIEK